MERENIKFSAGSAETREVYEAPVIEMIDIRVEQGFQLSLSSPDSDRDGNEYTW